MENQPFVSVILPIRNEENYITATLETLAGQDYPTHKLEVIISDGMSTDKTRELVAAFIGKNHQLSVKLIDNPEQTVPFGLNRAIRGSKGEVIVRMDSHSVYPTHYISRLVDALYRYEAHNTGGTVKTVAAKDTLKCHAIATALSHPVGVGNAYFRIGSSKVREADTVPFGCFRREVFDKIGLFDEEMIRTQDSEFNGRMKNAGLKILLIPNVEVTYYARDTYRKLYKMYFQYGLYKPLASLKLGGVPTVRQLIPLFFVLFLFSGLIWTCILPILIIPYLAVLMFYTGAIGYAAIREASRQKRPFILQLMLSFFILHFSYGTGYVKGITALLLNKRSVFTGKISISR